jgi:SAM-dependent methyltransferase
MSNSDVLRGYAADAPQLGPQFEAIATEEFLAPVAAWLPESPARILDCGAGTGRDAAWLAEQGHHVVAVEPVDELREAGRALHLNEQIRWVKDELPALANLEREAADFDLILVLAVWQHLRPEVHRQAMQVLAAKVAPQGRLILSLRHGPGAPFRPCYMASADDIVAYGTEAGLRLLLRQSAESIQQRNRDRGVTWTWLCFER